MAPGSWFLPRTSEGKGPVLDGHNPGSADQPAEMTTEGCPRLIRLVLVVLNRVEEVIRRRLVTDERVLRKLARRLVARGGPLEGTAEERLQHVDDVIRPEVELLRGNLEKQERALGVHKEEEDYYHGRQKQLEGEIDEVRTEIANLKDLLQREREIRRNKDAYDLIAREILTLPSREELYSLLESVESQIEQVNATQSEIQEHIERDAIAGYQAIQALKLAKRQVEIDLKTSRSIA